ncbi:hypothetical protein ATCC90586_005505 [Pythium insidiosum]|nr:hypothetical protein ATCC90586_005505 [Pythium insidiosum]
MSLVLAQRAESEIAAFFRRPDALASLQSLYEQTISSLSAASASSSAKTTEQALNVLDMAVQKVVEKLSWQLLKDPDATPVSVGVPELLDLCIDGIVHKCLNSTAAYKLLEDLMDGQTISTCEKLWDLLEERKQRLSSSDFIPESGRPTKASLCLLRLCNALLRRVSKTHNSVFCGRILVFLSFTFALSERSAVNLLGKPNTANTTLFEDQDEFEAAEAHDSVQTSNTALPSAMELDKERDPDAAPVDYNLYRTFWDLQRFCRDHQLVTKSVEDWEKFFEELNTVLSAFEGNAFSPDDLERSRDLLAAPATADASHEHFFQPKYLTNSRLFRLQLRDPIMRECMLTQILILFNHLAKTKAPEGCQTPKSKLPELTDRVIKLLRETPSDGKGFSEMLTIVLERERNWIKWKLEKCPPYERLPATTPEEATAAAAAPPKKRRLGDAAPLGAMNKRLRSGNNNAGSSMLEQILSESAKPTAILEKMKAPDRATAVPIETYMQRFTEAWDPENGIEEEYWPDKEKLFCWRTLRAAMKSNVEHLHLAKNGAGAVVKGILGISNDTVSKADPVDSETSIKAEDAYSDNDEDNWDDELNLLAMQMQRYQYRRLSLPELWTICYDDSNSAGPRVIRLPPYKYVHVLDTNSNVSRVLAGPLTYTRQEHEHVSTAPKDMIVLPAQHYVEIHNPVVRDEDGNIVRDQYQQAKLRHGEVEFRIFDQFPDPFPLYPGELQAGSIKKLRVVPVDSALKVRATRKFDKFVAGDEWLFIGPATYVPRVEEEIVAEVNAIIIKKNQAIKFRAEKKCKDSLGIERDAGEEWLVRTPGAYLPQIDEVLVDVIFAHILTERTALHLRAVRTFKDVYGVQRKAGEEWLVTSEIAETHVPDVHEEVVGTVEITTLTNRQYCVIIDPVVDGVQRRGTREMRKGEASFFLQPGEGLENGCIEDVLILGEDEAVLLQANESFVSKECGKEQKHEAGERWMVHGPREYIPPIQVQVLEVRKAIPLDANEGVYVRDKKTGHVYDYKTKSSRIMFGPTLVMLEPEEQFTVLRLAGGVPKQPNVIKTLCLQLGPDFMRDQIIVETSDHARLRLTIAYNWHFRVNQADHAEASKVFNVKDFVGDACKTLASRIRGAVAVESFDHFHKHSAKIIRTSIFGVDENGKLRPSLVFDANYLCITNVDIQSAEPVDQLTRESLQKSVQLAIEITTKSQEARAKSQAMKEEEEAKGQLLTQQLENQAAAEQARKNLVQLSAECAAVEAEGEAVGKAKAAAQAAEIEGLAAVRQAELKAQADRIVHEASLRRLREEHELQIAHARQLAEIEVGKKRELMSIEAEKFQQLVGSIGKETLVEMARVGPENQVRMLEALGLNGYLITDGKSPVNLVGTAGGLISKIASDVGENESSAMSDNWHLEVKFHGRSIGMVGRLPAEKRNLLREFPKRLALSTKAKLNAVPSKGFFCKFVAKHVEEMKVYMIKNECSLCVTFVASTYNLTLYLLAPASLKDREGVVIGFIVAEVNHELEEKLVERQKVMQEIEITAKQMSSRFGDPMLEFELLMDQLETKPSAIPRIPKPPKLNFKKVDLSTITYKETNDNGTVGVAVSGIPNAVRRITKEEHHDGLNKVARCGELGETFVVVNGSVREVEKFQMQYGHRLTPFDGLVDAEGSVGGFPNDRVYEYPADIYWDASSFYNNCILVPGCIIDPQDDTGPIELNQLYIVTWKEVAQREEFFLAYGTSYYEDDDKESKGPSARGRTTARKLAARPNGIVEIGMELTHLSITTFRFQLAEGFEVFQAKVNSRTAKELAAFPGESHVRVDPAIYIRPGVHSKQAELVELTDKNFETRIRKTYRNFLKRKATQSANEQFECDIYTYSRFQ